MPSWEPRSSVGDAAPPPLPPRFTTIKDILDGDIKAGSFVNVIGVVKECQLPVATAGKDHKSTLTLLDCSTQDEGGRSLDAHIFRPLASMPQVSLGDVVLFWQVRIQVRGSRSLITHYSTAIRVYRAALIPKAPASPHTALTELDHSKHVPSSEENAYVSYLYHHIDKAALPDEHEFQQKAQASLNKKSKFSLLKDVRDGGFYDLVVRVARPPFARYSGAVTLYVTDYTENPHFHNHVFEDGDPYGYTSGNVDTDKAEWVGPYGQMSLQVTCFDPHSYYIEQHVGAGDWVALRNVQIKYGRDNRFLEGFMRASLNYTTRVNVHLIKLDEPADHERPLKEAIRRWRDYDIRKQKQLKELNAAKEAGEKRRESLAAGEKRKESPIPEQEQSRLNAKERRKAKRAKRQQEAAAAAAATTTTTAKEPTSEQQPSTNDPPSLDLNPHIICETHKTPFSLISSILRPSLHPTTNQPLPFTCSKHRVRVRVVDFFPHDLTNFACSRVLRDWDVLSDNDELSDLSDSASSTHSTKSFSAFNTQVPPRDSGKKVWEWRFALLLEDADPSAAAPSPKRLWALVDNIEGQCLTGLDATDLRRDPHTLAQLRQKMATLWGNLEEVKTQARAEQVAKRDHWRKEKEERKKQQQQQLAADNKGLSSKGRLPKPPVESSDVSEEEEEEEEEEGGEGTTCRFDPAKVSNMPFACYIRQYGVRGKDAEGNGTWVRCFGLFGTKICS